MDTKSTIQNDWILDRIAPSRIGASILAARFPNTKLISILVISRIKNLFRNLNKPF